MIGECVEQENWIERVTEMDKKVSEINIKLSKFKKEREQKEINAN